MSFDFETSLRLVAESLKLAHRFGASRIEVRDVRMDEQTLAVEFVAASTNDSDVKGEIAGVMGILSGLDIPTVFPALDAQSFGVRALDTEGRELLWIASSREAAAFVAKGQPLEWLARSVIQENTPAYRRSQADRRIGQIECALRDVIDHHGRELVGENYIDRLWGEPSVGQLRARARAETGTDADVRGLLDFTFLPQLRDAIAAHPGWFEDGCIQVLPRFNEGMVRLNGVRRKVAHHRPVTEEDLQTCQEVAEAVLGRLGRVHPEISRDFLVDRWEEQVAAAVDELQRTYATPSVPASGEAPEAERRRLVIQTLRTQLASVEGVVATLGRVVVPAQRIELHRALAAAVVHWRDGLVDLVAVAERPDLSVKDAKAAQAAYSAAMKEVRRLRQEVKAIRHGSFES